MKTSSFDNLVIDRVLSGWFTTSDGTVLAVLDQLSNLQINVTTEAKDKKDAQGALISRKYQAKAAEVTAENALFSMNLNALQSGSAKKTGSDVELPRIMAAEKGKNVILPDVPIDGTLIVYGTLENGLVDVEKKYEQGAAAGAGTYTVTTANGKTTIALPTDATSTVQIKYIFKVAEGKNAIRIDHDAISVPKTCEFTVQVLCSDVCDPETVDIFYIVFPRFQVTPDFDWTLDTESSQNLKGTALKDYCSKNQLLFYVAMSEDSDEYDAKAFN